MRSQKGAARAARRNARQAREVAAAAAAGAAAVVQVIPDLPRDAQRFIALTVLQAEQHDIRAWLRLSLVCKNWQQWLKGTFRRPGYIPVFHL